MKIGAFVIGGLAGAAIVMIMQRNRQFSAMAGSVGNNLRGRMGGMKEEAIEKMLNMRFKSRDAGESSDSREERSHSSSEGNLDKIARLAAQDASVQRQVNDILEQSGQHRI